MRARGALQEDCPLYGTIYGPVYASANRCTLDKARVSDNRPVADFSPTRGITGPCAVTATGESGLARSGHQRQANSN